MRILTNQAKLKRNRRISQVLFFVSLAILFGGLIFTNTAAFTNEALLIVPCLVMPIGLLTTLASVRMTNEYIRLPHPEDVLKEALKGIHNRSALYNYLLQPNHVLVTPAGIYSLTTRYQDARYRVEGEKWTDYRRRGPFAPLFIWLRQEGLNDPFTQARREAEIVQTIVDETLPGLPFKVQPVVVFTGTKVVLETVDPAVPVVYADTKRKPSLKSLLKEDTQPERIEPKAKGGKQVKDVAPKPFELSEEQMAALERAFLKAANQSLDDEDEEGETSEEENKAANES